VKTVLAVLIGVFASAQTLAQADCCCLPDPPKAGSRDSVPEGAPVSPGNADCGCASLEFRSESDPPAPAAVLAPVAVPFEAVEPAPPVFPPALSAEEGRAPDRDVGPPLHLRLHLLLI
jgi:hypothetical protein